MNQIGPAKRRRYEWEPCNVDKFDQSLTVQSDAEGTSIEEMIERYARTGNPDILNQRVGTFADVSNVEDYLSCLNTINEANQAFMELPARVRDAFANDPANLIEAMNNPDNREALENLGIVVKPSSGQATAPAAAPAPAAPPADAAATQPQTPATGAPPGAPQP